MFASVVLNQVVMVYCFSIETVYKHMNLVMESMNAVKLDVSVESLIPFPLLVSHGII